MRNACIYLGLFLFVFFFVLGPELASVTLTVGCWEPHGGFNIPYKMKNKAQKVCLPPSLFFSQPPPCHCYPYLKLEQLPHRSGKEKTQWCNNCSDKLYFITNKHLQAIKAYL